MRQIQLDPSWPESWIQSFHYDSLEVYGSREHKGYAYAYMNRHKETLRMVGAVARPGALILDVAAGQGNFTLALADLGYNVVWNDLRAELIDYVRLKDDSNRVNYQPGNVFDLPGDGRFDLALIAEVIEHVAHPDQFLKQVGQLVVPGGWIVMTTPNGEYFRNKLPKFSTCTNPGQFEDVQFKPNADGHIFLLHLDEIGELARSAALKVVETNLFTNPLTNGHLRSERILRFLSPRVVEVGERITRKLPMRIRRKVHTAMAVTFQRPIEPSLAI